MTPIFTALAREAALAAEALASGVTLLGKANAWQHGWYNRAFFDLSVGLERCAKLAIILDHYVDTGGQFPSDSDLRKYSHDITSLLAKTNEISQRHRSGREFNSLPDSEIHRGIVQTLSEFAKATRYYNLDLLGGGRSVSLGDPLAVWSTRVANPIVAQHYRADRRMRDEADAKALEESIGDSTSVIRYSEAGDRISGVAASHKHDAQNRVVQKWAPLYVLQIARFLAFLISDLGDKARAIGGEHIPYLHEFFVSFMNEDSYLKSRKTWSAMKLT